MKRARPHFVLFSLVLAGPAASAWQSSVSVARPASPSLKPPCPSSIEDQATGACIQASTDPTAGALLPLGPELFVAPTGEVGIGTISPEHALDVAGDLRAGRCAFGNEGSIGPILGVWDWMFDLTARITDFSTANTWDGLSSWIIVDPNQDLVGANRTWINSQDFYVYTPAANDKDVYFIGGPLMLAEHNGSGSIDFFVAADAEAWARGGHVERQVGAYLNAHAFGTATVSDNRAVEVQSGNGLPSASPLGGFAFVEDDYSVYVHSPYADGPLTNHYGIFLEDQGFGEQDSYAIYSRGGTTFLAGDVGIGTDTPGAKLDVAGDFVASGTKSFVEPHPLDPSKEIRFVCLEGNEVGTYFRGSAQLAGGVATIAVPEEFALVTAPEGLTVQLTPLGPGGELWVAEKGLFQIEVRGARDVDFDYVVNGVRHGYADFAVVRPRNTRPSVASTRPRTEREGSDAARPRHVQRAKR